MKPIVLIIITMLAVVGLFIFVSDDLPKAFDSQINASNNSIADKAMDRNTLPSEENDTNEIIQNESDSKEVIQNEIQTENMTTETDMDNSNLTIPIHEENKYVKDNNTGATEVDRWKSIASFAYQLQNINLDEIRNSNYDLVVIDYSPGSDFNNFTRDEILLAKNGGKKLIFAYLSIGEAENYRWYWNQQWDLNNDGIPDDSPSWLENSNPDWIGNYKVRYWEQGWQSILYGSESSYLDKILAAGFDGVVLDTVDSYMYWEEKEVKDAGEKMVELVSRISKYSKEKNKDFKIIANGGLELSTYPVYLNSIDGVLRESVWYIENEKQQIEETEYTISLLDAIKQNGKKVFIIEYNIEKENEIKSLASEKGYLSYVTTKNLDILR
ncbi:MAG: endo alpha-1,4 polygalactosaminidase [Candidatus Micrarchaeota archaeon]|nr:endo alpha-1,4 polygalactosaminidase [Candidatus Micrarchaeota archaeon]